MEKPRKKIASDLRNVVMKLSDENLSSEKLRKAIKDPDSAVGNIAVAFVDEPSFQSKPFFAHSKVSKFSDFWDDNWGKSKLVVEEKLLKSNDFFMGVMLREDKELFKVERLTPENDFYVPDESGFAEKKYNCTERKILATLIREFKKANLAFKGNIHLFTNLEPCLYCHRLINTFKEKYPEFNLYVYYDQLIESYFPEEEEEN